MSQIPKTEPITDNHMSEDEYEDCPDSKQNSFKWDSRKELALLNCMIKLKPAGVHKHLNMLLIRENVSKNLKKTIPTCAIWKYLHSYWNTDSADNLEKNTVKLHVEDFDIPKDEEWMQLILEQNKLLNVNDKNKDDISQAVVSNMDLKTLKSVKVMVEKLDSRNLLINCLKLNNILNWEKTLKNGPNSFQIKCTSTNLNNGTKRKLSDGINLNTDNNMCDNIIKEQSSTNVMLIKNTKYKYINSNKHSRTKKKIFH